jgi:hypothetical protein
VPRPRCAAPRLAGGGGLFFLVLPLTLPVVGLPSFALATAAAITAQAVSMLAIPRDERPTVPLRRPSGPRVASTAPENTPALGELRRRRGSKA